MRAGFWCVSPEVEGRREENGGVSRTRSASMIDCWVRSASRIGGVLSAGHEQQNVLAVIRRADRRFVD